MEEDRTDVVPGEIFDIEPDTKTREKKLLPKRSRYYHSRMDGNLLEAGKTYDCLPNTWVIFITSFDPFSKGRMVYTIRNHCVEGATTLFLNTTGRSVNVSKDLKELLAYMKETSVENAVNPRLKEIQEGIDYIKTDPTVREAYMTLGEYIRYEREEAAEEAAKEAAKEAADAKAEAANAKAEAAEARAEIERLKAELKKYQTAAGDSEKNIH